MNEKDSVLIQSLTDGMIQAFDEMLELHDNDPEMKEAIRQFIREAYQNPKETVKKAGRMYGRYEFTKTAVEKGLTR